MNSQKNEIIKENNFQYKYPMVSNANENNENNKLKKNKIENKSKIRKISLPIKKRYFDSKEKLNINKNPFKSNNNHLNENIFFSFGKKNPENNNNNNNNNKNYLGNDNIMPYPTKENIKNDILPENHIKKIDNNSSNNEFKKKKIKKYIITKSNIKNKQLYSLINKNSPLNDEFNKKNYINKTLTENFYKNKSDKDLKKIEEFMNKFKNKERSESLKNALNLYNRFKMLSRNNQFNNSFSQIKPRNNKILINQKSEDNFLSKKRIKQIEDNIKNNIFNKNEYNNYEKININNSYNTFNNSENKKPKKYFLRKIIREEKCYRDKNGNIHVVDYKQSLIDEDDNQNNNIRNDLNKFIKKDLSHKLFKIPNRKKEINNNNKKKINVKINQINNINSFNNIKNYSSIDNLNNINNIPNIKNNEDNNFNPNNTKKLRIINLSKKLFNYNLDYKNNQTNYNKEEFPEKIRLLKSTNNSKIKKIKKIPFIKIKNSNYNFLPKNYSFQDIYYFKDNNNSNNYNINRNKQINFNLNNNNINQTTINFLNKNKYNKKVRRYNNNIKDNSYNQYYNGVIPNYYENNELYSQTERPIIIKRNNNNFSFYESKSLSKNNPRKKKNNSICIVFERNGKYNINYLDNNFNNNYTHENINLNRKMNFPQNLKLNYNYKNPNF